MKTAELSRDVIQYFPYPTLRPGQNELIKSVYNAISSGGHIAAEGAAGLGKTIAVLSASLPVAKENDLKILYLARTHKQHERVIEELKEISRKARVTGVAVRGRKEMCLNPLITRHAPDARAAMEICEQLRERERCRFKISMDQNIDKCVELQKLIESRPFMASEIYELCKIERFCPYELVKLVIGNVDVVALSYMYLFDPVIRNSFLKYVSKSLGQIILILDEAHNVPGIATSIASSQLTIFSVKQAYQEAKNYGYDDIASFCRCLERIIEKVAEPVEEEVPLPPKLIVETIKSEGALDDLFSFSDYLYSTGNIICKRLLTLGKYPRSSIRKVGDFLLKWLETADDPAFVHILSKYETKRGRPSYRLEIIALDPRKVTESIISSAYCTISISGTLEPFEAYQKLVGLPENTICEILPSPFPEENILSLVCLGTTTSLDHRSEAMYRKMIQKIAEITRYTPANIGIFAASYEVLEGLLETGLEESISKPLLHEERGMSSKKNDLLLRRFRAYAENGGAVLLGVQGGRNSEGADFPGKQMESVVIAGVPYARPTPRVEAEIRYLEDQFPGRGQEFGYILPALKKASQAAGRPIRSHTDRGAIIFLDYRFSTAYCRRHLPDWVRRNLKTLPDEEGAIAKELILFFGFQQN
ncbi:MAG: helicase C-terminal domain-containing protein [Halobacteria archaeon]